MVALIFASPWHAAAAVFIIAGILWTLYLHFQ
jgi:hypothetical protein